MIDKVNLWEWRPKDIYYKVNYDLPYKGYLKLEDNNNIKDMKILFAIDGSYSTEFELYKKKLKNIKNKQYKKERGDIIYRWGTEIKKFCRVKYFL